MEIVAIDRNWNDKEAYKMLIEVFGKVGTANEIVIKARKRLAKILF